MCFSAEASLGVSAVLLPIGGFCAATALGKERAYVPIALIPLLFGLQQVCEAAVWLGLERGDMQLTRQGSRWFLFFALAFWQVWVPLATAAIEPRGVRRAAFLAMAVVGLAIGLLTYLPLAEGDAWGSARVIGRSIRYDFSAIPALRWAPLWAWPILYLTVVCAPLLTSRRDHLRLIGIAILITAATAFVAFQEALAPVWCFLAAALSVYLAYALHRLPLKDEATASAGTSKPAAQPGPPTT